MFHRNRNLQTEMIFFKKNTQKLKNIARYKSTIVRTANEISNRITCLQLFLSRWGLESAYKNGADGN